MAIGVEKGVRREPLRVGFPGGLVVEASYRGFSIQTDQPKKHGGGGTAPPPFDLFLASIATCAGYYALQFLRQRDLPTEGLAVELERETAEEGKRIETIRLRVDLPSDFPEKYRKPLERAIDQCAVKRHIIERRASRSSCLRSSIFLAIVGFKRWNRRRCHLGWRSFSNRISRRREPWRPSSKCCSELPQPTGEPSSTVEE